MGDLIQEIINELKLITEFKFVSIWNNQFDYMKEGEIYSFPMPCVFVEIQTDNLQDIGGQYQGSNLEVVLHIGQDFYNGANIDENFNIFALRDLVIKSISSFKPTTAGQIIKVAEIQDFEHSNVYHYKIQYLTHWIDNTAVKQQYYTTPPIQGNIILD